MRVLIDTNIFISYLLKRDPDSTITRIIEAAFENKYTLLLPHEVLFEFYKKLREKKYLATHISNEDAMEFTELLKTMAEELSGVTEEIPRVSQDKKDDYLLAYAVIGKADYLVSGDEVLQKIGKVESVKIISPADPLSMVVDWRACLGRLPKIHSWARQVSLARMWGTRWAKSSRETRSTSV